MNGSQRISPSLSEKSCSQQVVVLYQAGFTVMELVIVMAIVGVLATVAIPSLNQWVEHGAINNATTTLYLKLKQARTLAVAESRGVKVVLDTVNDTFTYDDNTGGACTYCRNEGIDFAQFSPQINLTANIASVRFNTLGETPDNGTITLATANYSKCIKINIIGRAYITPCP